MVSALLLLPNCLRLDCHVSTLKMAVLTVIFEFGKVFCFTDFLSGFLFRVRGRVRVRVGVGDGFRVRV